MIDITGQRIRELRVEKGITQSELAELLDKTCSAPRMWELGKSMPDAATIKKLASFFGCSSDYLLGISDFKTETEKTEYFNTERVFYEKLGDLRGRDKIKLIACLTRYISSYLETEDEVCLGFEHLTPLIDSVSCMLEEIKSAAARRDSEDEKPDGEKETEKSCELYANGIIALGGRKLNAYEALEGMHKKLFAAYLRIISGCRCHDREPDEGTDACEGADAGE
jgi:transcriptional regulator with XRE-family HTH domain